MNTVINFLIIAKDVLMSVAMLFIALGLASFMLNLNSHVEKFLSLTEYKTNINVKRDDEFYSKFDKFIQMHFSELMAQEMLNVMPINGEREAEILKKITSHIINNMSPSYMSYVSLYYNISILDKVILDKVHMLFIAHKLNSK